MVRQIKGKANRSVEGDVTCVLCGRWHFSYGKYPVCFECACGLMIQGVYEGYRHQLKHSDWKAEEVINAR